MEWVLKTKNVDLPVLESLNLFFDLETVKTKRVRSILNYEAKLAHYSLESKVVSKNFESFFKKSRDYRSRSFRKFFDYYPNTTYSVPALTLDKFFFNRLEKKNLIFSLSNNVLNLNTKLLAGEIVIFLNEFVSLGTLKVFEAFAEGFLSLANYQTVNSNVSLFCFKSLVFKSLNFSKLFFTIKRNVFLGSLLKLPKRAKIPGKITFTLNANTIFLTVSNGGGITLLQTSTGSLAKFGRIKKIRRESIQNNGFKRQKIVRRLKFQKMIKTSTKGKTKKIKQIFVKQLFRRQKGKRKIKIKDKIKFISQDFVKPLFELLETFLFRVRNTKSRKALLQDQKLKIKLEIKLEKLKKNNKTKTKTYRDLKTKLNFFKFRKKGRNKFFAKIAAKKK